MQVHTYTLVYIKSPIKTQSSSKLRLDEIFFLPPRLVYIWRPQLLSYYILEASGASLFILMKKMISIFY